METGDIEKTLVINLPLLDYRLNGLTVNNVMLRVGDFVENKLPVNLERCSAAVFKKILEAYDLKKEFLSFAKETGISGEEVRVAFIKKRISESLHNASRWAEIFVTEEEDRTNKRHRKHIKEMIPHLNEIIKISICFVREKK